MSLSSSISEKAVIKIGFRSINEYIAFRFFNFK